MKVLVLDVEGTIITGYDYKKKNKDQTFLAIIDSKLKNILTAFKNAGWLILLATGTDNTKLQYYENEFKKAGIHNLINHYSPEAHTKDDSKYQKLNKYKEQLHIESKNQVYFFDDGNDDVQVAFVNGYQNSFLVTSVKPLTTSLIELAQQENIAIKFPSAKKPGFFAPESEPLLPEQSDEQSNCCSCAIV